MASLSITRPQKRWIAGVCAGIARRAGVSPLLIRAIFVLSIALPGPQVLVYLVLWVLMPEEQPA